MSLIREGINSIRRSMVGVKLKDMEQSGCVLCFCFRIFNVHVQEGRRKEIIYLTTHSTHFIYGYMASDIW